MFNGKGKVGLLLIVMLALNACATGKTAVGQQNEPIKLGAILIQTGTGAVWGNNSRQGVELALDEINKAGGVLGRKVELIVEDNPSADQKSAISAYRKLTSIDGVKFIIGPNWTKAANAVAPLAADQDVVMISPSAGMPTFNETASNLFNVWPHDNEGAFALAEYAWQKGLKRAFIMAVQDDWYISMAEFFKERFEALGGEVVGFEKTAPSARSYMTEVTKLARSGAQVVFVSLQLDTTMGTFARQAREMGANQLLLTTLMDDDTLQSASGALEGPIFVTYEEPASAFKQAFKELHGTEPGITADTAYDAVKLLAQVIEQVVSFDTKLVAERLLGTHDYIGASGRINFDAKGGVVKKPHYNVIKNGAMTRLD